jgi:hypothetical protein
MVYCTSDTLPLVEVRSGTKFTAPFGSAFTKCRRTSNGLKLQHTIKQACLGVGSSLFPFGKHRFLVDRKVLLWDGLVHLWEHRIFDVIPIGSRIIGGFIGRNKEKSCIILIIIL